ncbi:MAG: NgoFVII family restriction endonuclease [bacterium]|nr:NgoFVII family restriction endonuclease [bacterium]
MLSKNLFDEVLMQPAQIGANKLYVVSGYATAAMAFRHLKNLKENNHEVEVELIVGMSPVDGLSQTNHKGFQELMQTTYAGNFSCSYLTEMPPVHSKVYVWFENDKPVSGFVGSANYTQNAFGKNQREVMTESDPLQGFEYFQKLVPQTIYCNNLEAENIVQIYNTRSYTRVKREKEAIQQQETDSTAVTVEPSLVGLPFVKITLLDKTNTSLPQRSGLNWGQRPEVRREPNQAYIKLPSSIYNTDFFPDRTVHFTVLTDDGKVLICSRAQDNGKAIHTPHNNSLIGEYFRNRLGVPNGAPVKLDDLLRYGRTDVNFYKIDDETYYMDFSVPQNG